MTDRFAACLAETLKWEGGWSNHKKDKGGATMRGVTQRVYDGYRDGHSLPRRTVREIEDAELRAIYRTGYWNLVRGDELPAGVDLIAFDMAVHSGPGRSVQRLQMALGNVKVDGHIGPATLAAVRRQNHMAGLAERFMAERRKYLRGLDDYVHFGKGWENRCNGIEPVALDMAGDLTLIAEPDRAIPQPIADADAQSATQGRAVAADPKPPRITEMVLAATGAVSNFTGIANAFSKWGAKPNARWHEVLFFFLAEPMVLAGVATTFGALTTWLWRRRFAP